MERSGVATARAAAGLGALARWVGARDDAGWGALPRLAADSAARPARGGRLRAPARWIVLGAIACGMLLACVWAAGHVARRGEMAVLRREAAADAALRAAVLRSELEKHRSAPLVLAEDPDVQALLRSPTPAAARAVDEKFEHLADGIRAAAIYVMDAEGATLAASNWRLPSSFVGSDYSFRPYFRNAMRRGASEYFALGNVSGHPGLFLARRVDGPTGPLGVVVVKVEFDEVEADWRTSDSITFVTNNEGVVLITNRPEWRFMTLGRLAPRKKAAIWRKRQFGDAPLSPLPLQPPGRDGEIWELPQSEAQPPSYVEASLPAPARGWGLHLLMPSGSALRKAVLSAQFTTLAVGGGLILGLFAVLARRDRLRRWAEERARVQAELEVRVEQRTAELRQTNERLVVEMEERKRVEAAQQILQDELVQANKLAVLGQIAAGVAHEINQPVAAIRTYADNARILLQRDRPEVVGENLATIAMLTERIGCITDDLRAFSRKTKRQTKPVVLAEAVATALRLTGPRFRQRNVHLSCERVPPGLEVQAERVRLEQVLVNLLQNALDALAACPEPSVRLSLVVRPDTVTLRLEDNGPGIAADAAEGLFTPFATTKPNGLGLGLVISKDIMTEFGGELILADTTEGAAFELLLRRLQ